MRRISPRSALAGLVFVALAVTTCALSVGSAPFGWHASWQAFFDPADPAHAVMVGLRAPRVAAAFAVGALLAMAGALLQNLLRNPLAEPYVLGLSGGAAAGALAAIALSLPLFWISAGAAAGSFTSLVMLLIIARREFSAASFAHAGERLILSGVMLAALWSALIALVVGLASGARLQGMMFWLMGDLGGAAASVALIEGAGIVALLILAATLADAARLDLMARGDETAAALGVAVAPLKLRIVILAALAAGVAVAVAGTIGFVGLVAPHAVRRVIGNAHGTLLPGAALTGGVLVVFADTLARTIIAPQQLPVGAIMAIIGAPVFLLLLWKRPT